MATNPYLVSDEPNVRFEVITTTGDAIGTKPDGSAYRYVGIPDGLGAFDNGDGTITILSNHELGATSGAVREHGATGAFVSRLVVDKQKLEVLSAEDAIKTVMLYDAASDTFAPAITQFGRFCSADLAAPTAFFNAASGLGTADRIFLTGEESGANGRAFAVVATGSETGTAYELDYLGKFSWENAVASPLAQDKTIVIGTDDATPGQVYVYVGDKQATGNAAEKAGLVGGVLYGIKVEGSPRVESASATIVSGSRFSLAEVGTSGDASALSGSETEAASDAAGVTEFLRPEDAAWDPNNPDVLYFVTTTFPSRMIKVTFDDIEDPLAGGIVEVVVDASDGVVALDNMTVAADGKVYLQEDPGGDVRLAKIWVYDPADGSVREIAEHNPEFFQPGAPGFLTTNEESSGIIDATALLGDADTQAFLLDVQAHFPIPGELVEGGQLLAMFVDDPFLIGGNGDDDLFGSIADETLSGGNGNDTARAGSGDDTVSGGNGNDRLEGGRGNDALAGGNGIDALDGGDGNDVLDGGNGDDLLEGGAGDDRLGGGSGDDRFVFDSAALTGDDVLTDFGRGDRILLTEELAANRGRVALDGGILAFADGDSIAVGYAGLRYDGLVSVDGVSYFAYAADGRPLVTESAVVQHAAMGRFEFHLDLV